MAVNYKRKLNKKKLMIFIMSILLLFVVIGFVYFLFNKDEVIAILDSERTTLDELEEYVKKYNGFTRW